MPRQYLHSITQTISTRKLKYVMQPVKSKPTERRRVRGRIRIKHVNANNLIIGPRSKIATIRREANGMNGAGMIAHRRKLPRLASRVRTTGIVDSVRRPDPHISICMASKSVSWDPSAEILIAQTYLQQPSPASSHPVKHRSYKPRNPFVHLSHGELAQPLKSSRCIRAAG